MASDLYTIDAKGLFGGLVSALVGGAVLAVLTVLSGVFGAGFDVFTVDWAVVLHNVVNAAIVGAMGGFSGFISHTFFSDKEGRFLGRY